MTSIFDQWHSRQIYYVDQIVSPVKKIKEFNEDCVDLDCKSEVVTEENGIIYLREKFSGKLQAIELEIKANMKDQNICKYFYIRSSGCSCSSSRYFEVVGTSSSSI